MDTTKKENVQKRKKGLETTRQILDTAADLFAKNGYDGVSIRQISKASSIKESSLYNHFSSKADLLDTLFSDFAKLIPLTRPDDEEIDQMLMIMTPQEVFKTIVFHVGKSVHGTLANTAMIINHEKFRNPRAAQIYFEYIIEEPVLYYERLITKMIARKMIKPVDAALISRQYNYIFLSLTNEYFMAQQGLADVNKVVGAMVKTLTFFCGLMTDTNGE